VALALHAIATLLPPMSTHSNLLGTLVPAAYRHLYDPAGNRSRPPTVRRGSTMIYSPTYSAPCAGEEERSADLASRVVGWMLAGANVSAECVKAVLHTQCTLDQQILGSTCLRIEHDHFREVRSATFGQLGTAGLPTVFKLAALALEEAASDALACVSACDKWVAPFFRRMPGLVTYGDAAAACLVGGAQHSVKSMAVIEAIQVSCQAPTHDLWTAPADDQREALLRHATRVVRCLLDRTPHDRNALVLAGDGYGEDFSRRLAEATHIQEARLPSPCVDHHLSSAAPLFTIQALIEAAVREAHPIRAVVWTVTTAGHAGALLVRCVPDARAFAHGWASAATSLSTSASPMRSLERTS
jgi:hypothetical protein